MKLDMTIFHDFFYAGPGEHKTGRASVSYVDKHFFSYSTQIGYIYKSKTTFTSWDGFSNTTRGHLGALRSASPYPCIEVPFEYNDNFRGMTDAKIVSTLKKRFLKGLTGSWVKARLAEGSKGRWYIRQFLKNFQKFLKVTGKSVSKRDQEKLDKLTAAIAETPEAQAKRRKAAATKAKKTREETLRKRKEADKICKARGLDTLTKKARFVFATWEHDKETSKEAFLLKNLLFKNSDSFVWYDEEKGVLRTSKKIKIQPKDVASAIRLYERGKLCMGMHVGPYTVLGESVAHVRIGCHRLRKQNIDQRVCLRRFAFAWHTQVPSPSNRCRTRK